MKPYDSIIIQSAQSNSLRATLARLDSYMDATGHGADHSWRIEIAAALAAQAQDESGIDRLGEALEVASVAHSFINDSIAPVMNAISELCGSSEMDPEASQRQLVLIRKLARLGNQLVDEAATHMEYVQHDLQTKLVSLGESA